MIFGGDFDHRFDVECFLPFVEFLDEFQRGFLVEAFHA